MRILSVTQSYYPFLEKGGPTVKVRAMARGLAARGHQVTVLTADLGLDVAGRDRPFRPVPFGQAIGSVLRSKSTQRIYGS